jgi:hypothetical protein
MRIKEKVSVTRPEHYSRVCPTLTTDADNLLVSPDQPCVNGHARNLASHLHPGAEEAQHMCDDLIHLYARALDELKKYVEENIRA